MDGFASLRERLLINLDGFEIAEFIIDLIEDWVQEKLRDKFLLSYLPYQAINTALSYTVLNIEAILRIKDDNYLNDDFENDSLEPVNFLWLRHI